MSRLIKLIDRNALKILLVWIVLLSFLYATLSILRHDHFQSGGFDLGLYDQAVWQYSKFKIPYNTVKERFILGDHLTLTLPLLAPLFWLWEDVRILLIFQAVWLSFSSLGIFWFCRTKKLSPFISLNLSFVYGLFYGIQYGVFFDFHPVMIGVGLIPWLIYFLESRQTKLFRLALVLLLLTQENMGLALAGLGLIYFFRKDYRRRALFFLAAGLAWSLMSAKIVSFFSPVGFQYWPEISPNLNKIISDFFNSQEKRLVWFHSFAWFSFLPLFSPGAVLAVVSDLAQYFITGPEFSRMWSPFMHHRAILAPFLFLGTVEVLGFLKKKKIRLELIVVFLAVSALGQQYFFHFPLNKLVKPIYWQKEPWMDDNRALFKLIPDGAKVASQQNLVPHLSHRNEIYLVWPRLKDLEPPPCGQKTCWWLDFGGQPEYLAVDLRPHQWLTQILETNQNFQAAVNNMEKAGKIVLEKEVNFAKLYKINYRDGT